MRYRLIPVLDGTCTQTNKDRNYVMTCLSVPLEILDNIGAVGISKFGFIGVDVFRIPRVLS